MTVGFLVMFAIGADVDVLVAKLPAPQGPRTLRRPADVVLESDHAHSGFVRFFWMMITVQSTFRVRIGCSWGLSGCGRRENCPASAFGRRAVRGAGSSRSSREP